ncbi:hypothetical protein ATANTOWER_010153, partial [Ataeniobius toweri]|nr:hypothetical protein [Ataeniobius toweri]
SLYIFCCALLTSLLERLTAYVAKVFAMATGHVHIESSVICGAIKFLILHTQQPDGMFVEIGDIYDKDMTGDVGDVDSDASMTAFCLIAMKESSEICSTTVNSLQNSMAKAIGYLEQRVQSLTNPYAVALTSYALAFHGKLNREILFKFAATDRSHWPVRKGHVHTLETTAYALYALVKDKPARLAADQVVEATAVSAFVKFCKAVALILQAEEHIAFSTPHTGFPRAALPSATHRIFQVSHLWEMFGQRHVGLG